MPKVTRLGKGGTEGSWTTSLLASTGASPASDPLTGLTILESKY